MVALMDGRLLAERSLDDDERRQGARRPARPRRSVTVNLAESPLGWLFSRRIVTQRQFDAGERLRLDWERAHLPPSVTMQWNAAPVGKRRSGSASAPDLSASSLDAKRRFQAAIDAAGPGLADILWRVVCAGESLPRAERSLSWPARSGKLVLRFALDRVAQFYHIE